MTDDGVIIILSEDDSDCDECSEPSVIIVDEKEVKKPARDMLPPNIVDEDLVITYSQHAEVLPHARYDCPIHPFTAVDCETVAPVGNNHLLCDQCFCYICDKLASLCSMWHQKGLCHCNSHKRSEFWSNLRNSVALGNLESFKLSILEMDSHLQKAEMMLQKFRSELAAKFSIFLTGVAVGPSNRQAVVHDYTQVYMCVFSFLDKADFQEDRAAALMRLGAAQDIIGHFQSPGCVTSSPKANVCDAIVLLMTRIVESVQRQMVMADFNPQFSGKLHDFFLRLNLPPKLKSMKNSLCVRPWTDVLLVNVLKGQNVTGVRHEKGKKDVLVEDTAVVFLRLELLQHQRRYRELYRYIRVIQTWQQQTWLPELQDLAPLFLCMAGDFSSAFAAFFTSHKGIASRLQPLQFILYLRIFETATAPTVPIAQSLQLDCNCTDAKWEPIKGAVPLNRVDLVKFALRVHMACEAVYENSECWAYLLTRINFNPISNTPLTAPSHAFLHDARIPLRTAIERQMEYRGPIDIPLHLLRIYPDQSLLLLVTEALALRIISAPLAPVLPVVSPFEESSWALNWLRESLSSSPDVFISLMQTAAQEMENKGPVQDSALHYSLHVHKMESLLKIH